MGAAQRPELSNALTVGYLQSDRVYTFDAAAKALNRDTKTLHRMVKSDGLPFCAIGSTGFISGRLFQQWVEDNSESKPRRLH
jgi:hypothetical protein